MRAFLAARLLLLARAAACAPWPAPLARAFLVHVPKCAGASLKAELAPLFAAAGVTFEAKEQCYPCGARAKKPTTRARAREKAHDARAPLGHARTHTR